MHHKAAPQQGTGNQASVIKQYYSYARYTVSLTCLAIISPHV